MFIGDRLLEDRTYSGINRAGHWNLLAIEHLQDVLRKRLQGSLQCWEVKMLVKINKNRIKSYGISEFYGFCLFICSLERSNLILSSSQCPFVLFCWLGSRQTSLDKFHWAMSQTKNEWFRSESYRLATLAIRSHLPCGCGDRIKSDHLRFVFTVLSVFTRLEIS